ncbi:hypothetical protein JTE90_000034 [Oedothorax gibbosus]|uniref:Uncharacterized protein n=1 Tax=Oedothorax gibbosus TaxID=931172 RepID=A0AAV6TGA2_9ARAC|nr:hypothetical protein JTE90_000034 [Oedothorax gibbosus]
MRCDKRARAGRPCTRTTPRVAEVIPEETICRAQSGRDRHVTVKAIGRQEVIDGSDVRFSGVPRLTPKEV